MSRAEHAEFLDDYYGWSRHIYDATRKFYLLGRDTVLTELLRQPWSSLVEVGVGTGRNLRWLQARRPGARYAGIDASEEMLRHAGRRAPFASLKKGFAEDCDLQQPLGGPPDVVLFSYCLSMVQDPGAALANARRQVAESGRVVVVDFGDLSGLPRPLREGLGAWLRAFHVEPLDVARLPVPPEVWRPGPARYFVSASLERRAESFGG